MIFWTIHTIKGTAGFLGFSRLEGLAHAGESLLSVLRDGELVLTPEITSGVLKTWMADCPEVSVPEKVSVTVPPPSSW